VRSGKNTSGSFPAECHLKATAGRLQLNFMAEVWMPYQNLGSFSIICCDNTNTKMSSLSPSSLNSAGTKAAGPSEVCAWHYTQSRLVGRLSPLAVSNSVLPEGVVT